MSKEEKVFNAGEKVILKKAKVYATYDTKVASVEKSGEFYIYNNIVKNERIRITDDAAKVGVPMSCTGWISINDIILE